MFPFSLIPFPWNLVAMAVAVAAVVGGIALAKHGYDEGKRDEGRAEIQQKWHEAVVAQQAREAAAAKEADDFQRRADAKRQLDFDKLAKRTVELESRLAARNISGDLAASLRDATRAANSEGTGKPAQTDPPAAGAPDELAIAKWYDQVALMYRACRERVDAWILWDDRRLAQ